VGTTKSNILTFCISTVHPHARGDNGVCRHGYSPFFGSPPRAWGQPYRERPGRAPPRFTPTRVGTTHYDDRQDSTWSVHPHARGDNSIMARLSAYHAGSPPRAWGQRYRSPANFELRTVHPHARGDNPLRTSHQEPVDGSPPRAWGQRVH